MASVGRVKDSDLPEKFFLDCEGAVCSTKRFPWKGNVALHGDGRVLVLGDADPDFDGAREIVAEYVAYDSIDDINDVLAQSTLKFG